MQAFLAGKGMDGWDPTDGETLRSLYSFIDATLSKGESYETAAEDLLSLYRGRESVYGEDHTLSNAFIEALIPDFLYMKAQLSISLTTTGEHGFMFDLVDFCIANEKYNESDALAREFLTVPGRTTPTNSSTANDDFLKWRIPNLSVQGLLARHGSPARDCYWEDSRLYTNPISEIKITDAYPREVFPKAPLKVTVTQQGGPQGGPQLEISDLCLQDWTTQTGNQARADLAARVKTSEIWHLLMRLHAAQDWSILLSLDLQHHHPRCRELNRLRSDSEGYPAHEAICKNDMYKPPYTIWISEDDVVKSDSTSEEVS